MPPQQHPPPQMPQQQPYHDPSVRFEPMPGGTLPPHLGGGANAAPPAQQPPMPTPTPELGNFLQGESNSLLFYENLAKAANAGEAEKEQALSLLESKKQNLHKLQNFHKQVAGDWTAEQGQAPAPEIADFRQGLKFALSQESKLLRAAANIHAGLKDPGQQHFMASVLYGKVADIAELASM